MLEAIIARNPTEKPYVEDVFSTYLYTGTGAAQTITNNINLLTTSAYDTTKTSQNNGATYYSPYIQDMTIDTAGNILTTGPSVGVGSSGVASLGTVKFNSTGSSIVWSREIRETSGAGATARKIVSDSSNNYYVLGRGTDSSGAAGYPMVVKYNSSGTLQWVKKYQFQSNDGVRMEIDSTGNPIIMVYGGTNRFPLEILKLNPSTGDVTLRISLENTTTAGGQLGVGSFTLDSSDNMYLWFYQYDYNSNFYYTILRKYNSSGVLQWDTILRNASNRLLVPNGGLVVDTDGTIFGLGSTEGSGGAGVSTPVIVKFSSSGAYQTMWRFGDTTSGTAITATGIAVDSNGVYISADRYIAGYTKSGTLLFQKKLSSITGPSASLYLYGMKIISGNFYIFGYTTESVVYGFFLKAANLSTIKGTNNNIIITDVNITPTALPTFSTSSTTVGSGFTTTTSTLTATEYTPYTYTVTLGSQAASTGQGLVWLKSRTDSSNHLLFDTVRGAENQMNTDSTAAQTSNTTSLTSFTSSGFSLSTNSDVNKNASNFVSWTFKKQPKFFDVVNYTGNGANRTISHSLGVAPGMIIVKRTDTTSDWQVYHRSLANTEYLVLNTAAAKATGATRWNSTTADASTFSLGTDATVNASGGTYVAYLFAHDTTADGVIQCGSYTGNGSSVGPSINLGWEPQWVMIKRADSTSGANWWMADSMRNMSLKDTLLLQANAATNELSDAVSYILPTPTGFNPATTYSGINESGGTYIYLAIRRGPMRVPTDATKVFSPVARTGTSAAAAVTSSFASDAVFIGNRDGSSGYGAVFWDKLRGVGQQLRAAYTSAEVLASDSVTAFTNTGIEVGADSANYSANRNTFTYINWLLRRAPSFFDIVCYTGTGSARTINHNLGVVPEFIIIKSRSAVSQWTCYNVTIGNTGIVYLNSDIAAATSARTEWNSTTPTSSVFSLGAAANVNTNAATYIAYLFASLPGISKIGSYTGNGSALNIDCGFTNGARFILIKRTDSTGDWYVWDTARGIVAANDPRLSLNTTVAEVTTDDSIDPLSTGFTVNQVAATNINVNNASYIYLAIA